MTFEDKIIQSTVEKLLKGIDYREEIINAINISFLDFSIEFFKKIVNAKFNNESISLDWYKSEFIEKEQLKTDVTEEILTKTIQEQRNKTKITIEPAFTAELEKNFKK